MLEELNLVFYIHLSLLSSFMNLILISNFMLVSLSPDASKDPLLTDCIDYLLKAGANANIPHNCWGAMPIETAAGYGRRKHVEMLFPFTSPIQTVSSWTVDGIITHVKSKHSKQKKALTGLRRIILDGLRWWVFDAKDQVGIILSLASPQQSLRDDMDRKLRIFSRNEHPFHKRPLELFVMPPRQVREMRPRARRALVGEQKKEQANRAKEENNAKNAKAEFTA